MQPDCAIYWTLGNFLKPLATINLPKSPTFLGIFCKGVKIYHFSSEIIFWATFIDIWQFSSGPSGGQPYSDTSPYEVGEYSLIVLSRSNRIFHYNKRKQDGLYNP